jgi:hypothetical protein
MQRSRGVFVSLTRVRTGDQPPENAAIVGQEMNRWLRDIDGFHGLLVLSREGSTLGLAFWESREIAEQHRAKRMEFLHRMLAVVEVEVEEILDYEVTFADLGPMRE